VYVGLLGNWFRKVD